MTNPTSHQFEIRVSGCLADHWSAEFTGMTLRHVDDIDTVLAGEVPDQSALFGVLHTIENLGLTVISVKTFPAGETAC